MMEQSGFVEQMGDIDEEISATLIAEVEKTPTFEGIDITAIQEAVRKIFDPDLLFAEFEIAFTDTLSEKQMNEFAAFYRSDTGQRILKVEIAASNTEVKTYIKNNLVQILTDLEDNQRRKELFQEMDEATHATEMGTSLAMNLGLSLVAGMAAANNQTGPDILSIARAQIEAAREMISGKVQRSVLARLAYIYRDTSEDDLRTYIEFLRTGTARAVNETAIAATEIALEERGYLLGVEFGRLISQREL
ncbi:MAG: DUF2059 domain-containing protein [Hyphomicrobiales bacterium]|nr:DUF2059 domain-containing protein [Hyphomicrobiales bacterium]MCP4999745.1 DUF2059 domain-containing protein [Hyphomicrobiales bacterium]